MGGPQPGVLVLSGVRPLWGHGGDTVGMVLPQQSPGLWLLSGPKREAFLGKYLVFGGAGKIGARLASPGTWDTAGTRGTRSPRAELPSPAIPDVLQHRRATAGSATSGCW